MAVKGGNIEVGIKFQLDVQDTLKELEKIQKKFTKEEFIKLNPDIDMSKVNEEFNKTKKAAADLERVIKKSLNMETGVINIQKLNNQLKNIDVSRIKQAGAQGEVAFNNMYKAALTTHNQVKKVQTTLDKMGTTLSNTIKWGISSSIMNNFTGAVQQAYGYVKSLDTALNDIRIVTGKSSEEMERFAIQANNAAKALGKTTNDYTKASLIYYQQGLSDEETAARTNVTLKAASVTGQTASEVSEQLTAVWNGYKVSAQETELYIDKLAKVAAETAADLEELSTGMSKVASAANIMGVDVDQLNAQLATIISVTREAPETIGTSLKTVYARMATIKAGGIDEEDGATLTSYTEKMNQLGINVLDSNNNLRDMGEVIEEIGGKWASMTREQQVSLAQTIAGTRQYSRMMSLFDNWDMYEKTLNTSMNAQGTLQKQQDIYMDSMEAHLNTLTAQWEDLYDSILDENGLKTLIDGFTDVLKVITKITDAIGGGTGLIALLGAVGGRLVGKGIASDVTKKMGERFQAASYQRAMDQKVKAVNDDGTMKYVSEAQRKMTQLTNDYVKYYKYLSETQLKQAEEAVAYIGDLENQKALLKEQLKNQQDLTKEKEKTLEKTRLEVQENKDNLKVKEEELRKLTSRKGTDYHNVKTGVAAARDLAKKNQVQGKSITGLDFTQTLNVSQVDNIVKELNQLSKATQNLIDPNSIENVGKLNSALEKFANIKDGKISGKSSIDKLQEFGLLSPAQAESYKKQLAEITSKYKDQNEAIKAARELFRKINSEVKKNADTYTNAAKSLKAWQTKVQETEKEIEKLKQAIESGNGATEKQEQELQDAIDKLNQYKEALKNAESQNSIFRDNAATEAAISGNIGQITENAGKAIGALSSVTMGITSIKAGLDALSNSDLSWGEKLSSVLTSFTMGLPMLVNGVAQGVTSVLSLSAGFKTLIPNLVEYGVATEIVTDKELEQILADQLGLETKELKILLSKESTLVEKGEALAKKGLISTQVVENAKTGDSVALGELENAVRSKCILAIIAEIKAKGLLTTIQTRLNNKIAESVVLQQLGVNSIKSLILLIGKLTIVIAAVVAIISSAVMLYKTYKNGLEETAKASKQAAQEAKKQTEALKEQTKQIDELVDKYKELKEQYGETDIEKLRQETYKLCKQYGQQDLAIKALTASYEELNQIMDETQTKAHADYTEAINKEIGATTNSIKDNIWSNMKSSQRDTRGGQKTIDLKGQGLIKESLFDYDNSADFREALERLGLDTDASGHINLDKFVEVAATNSEELLKVLESSTSAGATQLLEIYKEYEEDINRIVELNKEKLGEDAFSIVNPSTIDSVQKFDTAIKKLVSNKKVLDNFGGDKAKAEEWAKSWLGSFEEVSKYAQKSDLFNELNNQGIDVSGISNAKTSTLTFLLKYKDLANTYDSPQDFLDKFNALIASQDRKEAILNIKLALNKDELTDEDISELFSNETVAQYIGMTEEAFKAYATGGGQQRIMEEALTKMREAETDSLQEQQAIWDEAEKKAKEAENTLKNLTEAEKINKEQWNKFTEEANSRKEKTIASYDIDEHTGEVKNINYRETYQEDDIKKLETYKNLERQLTDNQKEQEAIIAETNELLYERQEYYKQMAASAQSTTELEEMLKNKEISEKEYYENYKRLDREQDLEGLDATELQNYRKYLQETAESSDDLSNSLKEDSEAAEIVAKSVMKMNKGIELLSSNFETWNSILQESEEGSQEYAEAMTGIKDAMSKLLDINEDYISNNFITNNLEEIQKAAEGDAEAIDNLHRILAKDVVMNLQLDDENMRNQLASAVDSWQAELDNMHLEAGDIVDDTGFLAGLNDMIESAGMTVDQVNALFDSMGFETQFEESKEGITGYRTDTTTHHIITNRKTETVGGNDTVETYDEREISEQTQTPVYGEASVFAMTTDGSKPQIKSLTKKASGSMNNASSSNKGGNKSSSGGGGGKSGGSEKKPNTEKHLEREEDIYRQINAEISQIENTLNRIRKVDDHSWGASAQVAIEKESKELDALLKKYEQKKVMQEKDLGSRRYQLEQKGIQFTADGSAMTNAEEWLDKKYAEYNAMVDKYNSMSAEEQEAYKGQLDKFKQDIDDVEKAMKDYESGFSDYQSTLNTLLEKHYEQIELAVKKFNNKINVELDLDNAKKTWEDFWYDVVQDVDDNDFIGKFEKSVTRMKDLLQGDSGMGIIGDITSHLNDTIAEVNKQIAGAANGGGDSMFGDDTALSKETLLQWRDSLIQYVTEAKQQLDALADNYLKVLDSAQEKIDEHIKGLESITDHLDHNIKLIEMISGTKAYDAFNKQYEKTYETNLKTIETQRMSKDYWADQMEHYKKLMDSVDKNSKAYKTYSEAYKKSVENYRQAVNDLDAAVENALEKLEEWHQKQLEEIQDKLEKGLTGVSVGLDTVEKEWQLINKWADQYYDNVERSINTEEYAHYLEQVANNTELSAESQKKLNEFRDEELKKLKEKENLTQYDIDESKARLAILQQEIALQDAQQQKNKMRLRRDSQGNYTYQYVGDDAAVEDAENKMFTAKKEWYALVKQRLKDVTEYSMELAKQQAELLKEIDEAVKNGETEKANLLKDLYKRNADEIAKFGKEVEKNQKDIYSGLNAYFSDVQNKEMIPQFESTAYQMAERFGEASTEVQKSISGAMAEVTQLLEDYGQRTKEILEQAGIDYNNMVENGIDPTTDALEDLVGTNEDLADELDKVNETLREQEKELETMEELYNNLRDAAVKAIDEANKALETLSKTAIDSLKDVEAAIKTVNDARNQSNNGGTGDTDPSAPSDVGGSDSNPSSPTPNTPQNKKKQIYYKWLESLPNGVERYGVYDKNRKFTNSVTFTPNPGLYNFKDIEHYLRYKYGENYIISKFKSGGYTGTWAGSSSLENGKLAVLHQKELVLNASDTQNLLDTVKTLRGLQFDRLIENLNISANTPYELLSDLDRQIDAIQTTIAAQSPTFTGDVIINADFPNATDMDEIYQAFVELENVGMQAIYSNSPLQSISIVRGGGIYDRNYK